MEDHRPFARVVRLSDLLLGGGGGRCGLKVSADDASAGKNRICS